MKVPFFSLLIIIIIKSPVKSFVATKTSIQVDWENREFISQMTNNVKKLVGFLNNFGEFEQQFFLFFNLFFVCCVFFFFFVVGVFVFVE
jgi:hypothetical protein